MKQYRFDKNLIVLRKDRGWTQQQLADKAGIPMSNISKLESGYGNPKLSTLYKLMTALACSYNDLIMGIKEPEKQNRAGIYVEKAFLLPDEDQCKIVELINVFIDADKYRSQHHD